MTLDELEKNIEILKQGQNLPHSVERDRETAKIYDFEEQKRCLTGKASQNEFDNFMKDFVRCGF